MKLRGKAKPRKVVSLRDQVAGYLRKREDCMVLPLDVPGRPLLVLRRAEFTVIETVNPSGFQPHEQKREVIAPRGLVLVFRHGWSDAEQEDCMAVGLEVLWPKKLADVEGALR